jgi:hypothetical protein
MQKNCDFTDAVVMVTKFRTGIVVSYLSVISWYSCCCWFCFIYDGTRSTIAFSDLKLMMRLLRCQSFDPQIQYHIIIHHLASSILTQIQFPPSLHRPYKCGKPQSSHKKKRENTTKKHEPNIYKTSASHITVRLEGAYREI